MSLIVINTEGWSAVFFIAKYFIFGFAIGWLIKTWSVHKKEKCLST